MTVRNAASMPAYFSDWEVRGYHGCGNTQELLGSLNGRSAIVCGNGKGVFEEFDAACEKIDNPVVFACNDVGIYLPILHHWVSLHTDNMHTWKSVRWLPNYCESIEVTKYHGIDKRPGIDYVWDRLTPQFSISGYFAMQLAWVMGCDRIVLCGCPGTYTPRFFESKPKQNGMGYGGGPSNGDEGIKIQLMHEMKRNPDFQHAVRSMSGFTQEFFGGI